MTLLKATKDVERPPGTPKKSNRFELRYDVRISSQGYSNIASVLAGFALAAVVLVVQSSPPAIEGAALLRDWASIAFFVAFFGCVMAAFVFAVVAGEEILAPRSHTMALIGGSGLAMSTVYIFWGLVILTKLFLSPSIVPLARLIFVGVTLIAPLYLMLAALSATGVGFEGLDVEPIEISTRTWIQLLAFGYVPISFGIFNLLFHLAPVETSYFGPFVIVSCVLLGIGMVGALLISIFRRAFRLGLTLSALWISLHSCISGVLLTLLP